MNLDESLKNRESKLMQFIDLSLPLFLSTIPFFLTDVVAGIIDNYKWLLFWNLSGWIGFFLIMYFTSDLMSLSLKNYIKNKHKIGRLLGILFIMGFLLILTTSLAGKLPN